MRTRFPRDADRRSRLGRQRVARRPQDRVARLGGPARRPASRTPGRSAGATTTVSDGSPAADVCRRSIPCASDDGLEPLTWVTRRSSGSGRLADADDLGVLRPPRARRRQLLQRLGAGRRQLAAVGEQHRCAQGRRHQLGGGDGGAPVALLDDHDGARAALVGARRVHRARDAGSVGHRVGADHARRVLGGEDREPERRGVLGLLLVAARAEHRLAAAALAAPRPPPSSPPPPQPIRRARRRRGSSRRSTIGIKLAATLSRRPRSRFS